MSKIPPEMRRNGRPIIPHFLKDEYLYRRVPLRICDDAASPLEVSAVELPDISVGRSKFGHPEWLRLDKDRNFDGWGVIGVQVQDVPPERWLEGSFRFRFQPTHVPEEWNYPHAEIQAFQGEKHIQMLEELPEEVHLE